MLFLEREHKVKGSLYPTLPTIDVISFYQKGVVLIALNSQCLYPTLVVL